MRLDICVGGSGGQGVLVFGTAIIYAAVQEGKRAICLPSYGAEARGGEVSCFVVFSDGQINSPFADTVDHLVFFNEASFGKFREYLRPGVGLMYNSSEVADPQLAEGVRAVGVPLYELAAGLDRRCANMVMLGAFAESTRLLGFRPLEESFRRAFAKKGEGFITMNLEAIARGREWAQGLPETAPASGPSAGA